MRNIVECFNASNPKNYVSCVTLRNSHCILHKERFYISRYTIHILLRDISRSWEKDRSGRFVGFRGCLLSCGTHFRFAHYRCGLIRQNEKCRVHQTALDIKSERNQIQSNLSVFFTRKIDLVNSLPGLLPIIFNFSHYSMILRPKISSSYSMDLYYS